MTPAVWQISMEPQARDLKEIKLVLNRNWTVSKMASGNLKSNSQK